MLPPPPPPPRAVTDDGAEGNSTELASVCRSVGLSVGDGVRPSVVRSTAVGGGREGGGVVRVVKLCSGPVERAGARRDGPTDTR